MVANAATAPGETIHAMPFEVRGEDVLAALVSVGRLARRIRAAAKLPEPVPHVPRTKEST
ncbi:hypothetical protein D5S19_07665 [Amycolatopsis panacis]|uniref:Uncharacterized protein n=1 Tax=Amycolatopsis panacis TaxID=2340917 RepID=A0A419I7Y7_9PSEU|nr:hypothetical protein D5S19_07665 [Amycolatopsis panacis]